MTEEEVRAIVREELVNALRLITWDMKDYDCDDAIGLDQIFDQVRWRVENGERSR